MKPLDETLEELDTKSNTKPSLAMTENRAAFLAELRLNGGNVSKAAVTVGINPAYARRLVTKDPVFKMLAKATKNAPLARLTEWSKLAIKAQETMAELLESTDQRVRFMAAREILDRAEGKPTQKVERKETKITATIDQETMMMALALVGSGSVGSLQEGILKARTEPEKVKQWLEEGKQLSGREIKQ